MERIVIEVDDETAKKWRIASSKFKKVISEKITNDLNFISENYKTENFLASLDEIGEVLASRGLTEEIVNEILNSDD
jgi:FKBP-type peptidyl-prolyl cis-trans isomerase (trigger factor)